MTDAKQPPSLGLVSDPRNKDVFEERRRVPRLNLSTEQFRLSANGKIFPVSDLSVSGMALRILDRQDFLLFPVGMVLNGTLNIRRNKHEVQARVRHLARDLVGCEFDQMSEPMQDALKSFLDPAELGKSLHPIPAVEPGMLWYQGPSATDLLFWRGTDGQYYRLALCVLGIYVQWDHEQGISTGRVAKSPEASEVRGVVRFETVLLDRDAEPDAGKLSIAKTLILSSNLPQNLKTWCVRQLRLERD